MKHVPLSLQQARDRFIAEFRIFLSEHLDSHHGAETTLELEVAALITMVDVGRTSVHTELWRGTLDVIREYAERSLRGEDGARLRATYRLADQHAERVSKL